MQHAPYQNTGTEHLDVLHTIARWTPEQLTYPVEYGLLCAHRVFKGRPLGFQV
jgi:hypothetical protein